MRMFEVFEKKILYVNLIGLLITTIMLLSGKSYYYNYLGEFKLYSENICKLCGFVIFLFFMKDEKFKIKYWIFFIISVQILSFFTDLFFMLLLTSKIINISTYTFILFLINAIISSFLYKIFKEKSYRKQLL